MTTTIDIHSEIAYANSQNSALTLDCEYGHLAGAPKTELGQSIIDRYVEMSEGDCKVEQQQPVGPYRSPSFEASYQTCYTLC